MKHNLFKRVLYKSNNKNNTSFNHSVLKFFELAPCKSVECLALNNYFKKYLTKFYNFSYTYYS